MITRLFYFFICSIHLYALAELLPVRLPIWLIAIVGIAIGAFSYRFVHVHYTIAFTQLLLISLYLWVDDYGRFIIVVISITMFWLASTIQQQNRLQQKMANIAVQHDQFNETFQTVRKERHDYLKHVTTIQFLLEKNQFEDAKSYMAGLITQYEETNLSIKGENGAVAAILHDLYKQARQQNIAINYHFETPFSQLPLSDQALVTLLGNMLENALDACSAWQHQNDTQGFVDLSLHKQSGLYVIECKNSSLALPHKIADSLFITSGISIKEGHEGLGTSIIQEIIKQHQGYLDFTYERGIFALKIKLPNIHAI